MRHPSPATDPAAAALRERLRGRTWRVLRSGPGTGAWNLALDEALLDAAVEGQTPPTLRFYTWSPPAVSLGRFQSLEGIDTSYLRERRWDLVRRPTGGRAVLHHLELTYSIVLPPEAVGSAGVRASYAVLVGALNAGLQRLLGEAGPAPGPAPEGCDARANGQPNCFALASECDSLVPGGKLVGSAQVRRGGALLQHGSILLDAEPEAWEALFGTAGRMTTLRRLLGCAPDPETAAEAIAAGFRALGVELRSGQSSAVEIERARALAGGLTDGTAHSAAASGDPEACTRSDP